MKKVKKYKIDKLNINEVNSLMEVTQKIVNDIINNITNLDSFLDNQEVKNDYHKNLNDIYLIYLKLGKSKNKFIDKLSKKVKKGKVKIEEVYLSPNKLIVIEFSNGKILEVNVPKIFANSGNIIKFEIKNKRIFISDNNVEMGFTIKELIK